MQELKNNIYKTVIGKLSNLSNMSVTVANTELLAFDQVIYMDFEKLKSSLSQTTNNWIKIYLNDIYEVFNAHPELHSIKFLIALGDIRMCPPNYISHTSNNTIIPIISKTRGISVDSLSLIMLDTVPHFNPIQQVPKNDMLFKDKKNCIIWRGTTTGHHYFVNDNSENTVLMTKRLALVSKYYQYDKSKINVGFSYLCAQMNSSEYNKYVSNTMNMQELLKYKFLLSVEGNDVATGLKWMLSSNSVVLMPKPTCISIICENLLEPYVHYIPVADDFSDLEQIYEWCLNNLDKCQEIIHNANMYMSVFTKDFMIDLSAYVLHQYSDKINIIIKNKKN